MPKVSINIIKEWFKNQSKPPQEQFWAWLDSFWHKDEPIPQSAVENLVTTLQKKADLVDGVVPEDQLPFSVVTSEVISLGAVTIDGNQVKLAVHSSGENKVRVKGKTIIRTFPNQWTFTPIADNGVKVIRGYAVKNEDDFFISEGPELPEYQQPEIPPDALQLFEFTLTAAGITLVQEDLLAFQLKANEAWAKLIMNGGGGIDAVSIHHAALRFKISSGFGNIKIGGFRFYQMQYLYDGVEITLRNETGGVLELATVVASSNLFPINPADLPVNLKIGESCVLVYDASMQLFNVMKHGGGGASFPETGSDGDVLTKSGTNALWSSIIKGVEFLGNAWLKLKLISFQGYMIAQKNAIPAPQEGMLIYQNENPKGFQKYENGTWMPLGNNISNADLSNVSARTFLQAADFTWNTAGFKYYLKNLVDKTGNAAYTKVVIVHPTTGETVTRDFADPAATTLAVQNASAGQKAVMRTALLGTSTPANPALQDVSVRFVTRGVIMFDIYGINLTLLDPTFIWVEKTDGTKIYATNFYNITGNAFTSQWNLPSDLPNGDYDIKIQNGVTDQGLSTAKITVVDSIAVTPLLNINWKRRFRLKTDGTEAAASGASSSDDVVSMQGSGVSGYDAANALTWPAIIYKSSNIFLGSKDFDITIDISTSVASNSSRFMPFIGLTETDDSNFISTNIIRNTNTLEGINQFKLSEASSQYTATAITTLYISKVGNKIFYRMFNKNTLTNFSYFQTSIDTSKNHALFLTDNSVTGGVWSSRTYFTTARIMN